jgi:DNA-binding NarL/FixJ family response regulator
MVMPRMSGRKLVERLAMVRPSLRVLFMTGYTDESTALHGYPIVQKPLMPETLLAKVREVLAG